MNDESDETGVSISSTSLISAQLSSDVRSGMELLEDMLLGRHSSGLVASPFIDAVKNDNAKLQVFNTLFLYMVLHHMVLPLTIAV